MDVTLGYIAPRLMALKIKDEGDQLYCRNMYHEWETSERNTNFNPKT